MLSQPYGIVVEMETIGGLKTKLLPADSSQSGGFSQYFHIESKHETAEIDCYMWAEKETEKSSISSPVSKKAFLPSLYPLRPENPQGSEGACLFP